MSRFGSISSTAIDENKSRNIHKNTRKSKTYIRKQLSNNETCIAKKYQRSLIFANRFKIFLRIVQFVIIMLIILNILLKLLNKL